MTITQVQRSAVLRLKKVTEKTGLSRSSIYYKINPASKYFDASFPKPIRLGAGSIGWLESDLDVWLTSRPLVGAAKAA
ncbi:AlpA family phage regulatory protein [Burkholderia pseudomallei]|uniref:AlpA family phage regulatory protein n=1 Tax=Burkholderia pseudomallei TaxID=28450 RepID=UPI000F086150|nr:AlpA family phage regulatory protein [Burkholderia pseudomallei]VCJ27984.1 phage transcriptional regulator AlpA [Burkholderia pseudomallei]VCJ28900.1 phage transcriptional regulator AlpA [Burkholderia pseudomallei]